MTKIMLVEDDKSLREIYGVRLLAEGYDIVSAGDGEEALAMAIKERPKLIISDVMMPKISGFDMLDILRSTTETREIKVIMMTALSSEDQRLRGEQMGADRYLVKSQVGIEDVVRVVHDVLADAAPAAAAPAPVAAPAPAFPTPAPSAPAPTVAPAAPARAPTPPASATIAPQQPPRFPQAPAAPAIAPHPAASAGHPMPPISSTTATPPSAKQRIIQPIVGAQPKVDINALLDRELARESGTTGGPAPQVPTTAQEKATVQSQISAFGQSPAAPAPAAAPVQPATPPTQDDQPQQRPAVQVPERPVEPPRPPAPAQ
ncbi:MAG TPA: response regulator [Candidatus Saccharimonadales bacterium]|nr:response regulator [Candidatus Saccharimonadales bacterium]